MAEIKPLLDRQIKLAGFWEYLKPTAKWLGFILAVSGGSIGAERLLKLLAGAL
jgi:hypothetical protein